MSKTRAEIMDIAVEGIALQVERLRGMAEKDVLEPNHARSLNEHLRVLSLVEKDRREAHKEGVSDAKVMTDEELESELLKAAKEIEARRGSGPK
jgi:hypothetical protein